jgi:integrase/recombinase XerD
MARLPGLSLSKCFVCSLICQHNLGTSGAVGGTYDRRILLQPVGALAAHLGAFASFLAGGGYSQDGTIEHVVSLARQFGRWLERRERSLQDLAEADVVAFLRWRWRKRRRGRSDRSALHLLLEFLRNQDIVPRLRMPVPADGFERELQVYADYLTEERALADATIFRYRYLVGQFIRSPYARRRGSARALRASDIQAFILRQVGMGSRSAAKLMVTALRSFSRFLRFRGVIDADLAAGVPPVANWRMTALAKSISADEVRLVLGTCDRRTAKGRRDYAILLLLARLGLRSREVVGMTLDDLDWVQGELIVRGKCGRVDRLPMSSDIGHALAAYIRRDRPACSTRSVFLRFRAPRGGLTSAGIATVVMRAVQRAGLEPPQSGAYLLRHSLATNMLPKGASLGEIGELLRHEAPTTTQIYAKHDLDGLRMVAQPWPGGR